jgi:hypothetical protein
VADECSSDRQNVLSSFVELCGGRVKLICVGTPDLLSPPLAASASLIRLEGLADARRSKSCVSGCWSPPETMLLEYVRYHHEDRTYLGLDKGTPEGRIRSEASGRSFHRSDSEGCTIVTVERHSSDRLSAGPLYICALHAHRARPLRF